ncbi:MAG: BlaI/MecI/CopY family transcriptional regulator [Lachnospiraceae bacterium]|nr:BlaI/MecI/CopY family transcriptional regulator [Lachnospiraceae bacterium]
MREQAEYPKSHDRKEHHLFDSEYRFMKLVWEHEPVRSMELARLCLAELGWKKSTCFTVLKKLAERGFVKNEQAVVTAEIKEEEVQRQESKAVVDKSFSGSLPAFVTAFLSERKLTREEAEEIREMIEKAVER